MPKAKPDRVEVIRFELQESERQILRDYVTINGVNKLVGTILQNFTAIVKDTTALIAIFILLKEIFPNFNPQFTSGMSSDEVLNEAVGAYNILKETGVDPFAFAELRQESGRSDRAATSFFGGLINLFFKPFEAFGRGGDEPFLNSETREEAEARTEN
jgi:hypothetical protein|tara:strand:+ start:1380 stop:1853 length:474 start_codon:yes stop_codon:yes gene_type:complete